MRAIRRSKRHEDLVELLVGVNQPGETRPVFPTMRELQCFSAVLGFQLNRHKELDGVTKEIDGRTFDTHDLSRDLIYLIALAHSKDAEVLREENEDECVSIFERYCEGGFEEIAQWLKDCPTDPHGDTAILHALRKQGFLAGSPKVDDAIHDVDF